MSHEEELREALGLQKNSNDAPGDDAPGDAVNHPPHYTSHPSGIECIAVTEHMSFCVGNAIKYLWRADLKGNAIEDLEKAKWYIERELAKRKSSQRIDRRA